MKLPYNISYSMWNLYKKSQILFYFQYVKRLKKSNESKLQVYGDAGSVIHNAIEDYINWEVDSFFERWKHYKIDEKRGFNNSKLDMIKYRKMYVLGISKCLQFTKNVQVELKLELDKFGQKFKSYIDVADFINNTIYFYDWKTNSVFNSELHYDQRLFYSWMSLNLFNKIPKCEWIYLNKIGKEENNFSKRELNRFDKEMQDFVKTLEEKGDDISKYEMGDWKNPANCWIKECEEEYLRRINKKNKKITLKIKGFFVFIDGDINPKLLNGIDYGTKFNLKDKYFMQEYAKKNMRGYINIKDIGTYHLFNMKLKCFPIGLLDKVTKIIQDYNNFTNSDIKIYLEDKRDITIMNIKHSNYPKKLLSDKTLREYQKEAVNIFLNKKTGILQLPTGAGKTLIATEIIRKVKGSTLWIIDRKELLQQTKEVLEKELGIKVGEINGKTFNPSEILTIATVQSLNSKLNKIKDFLYNINFVVVDEYHKSAAESFQKIFSKLPNTKYKLGLTATPFRDDGKTPILASILGEIIYKVDSQYLINNGFLVRPTIIFKKLDYDYFQSEKIRYSEEYSKYIIDDNDRNSYICNICKNNMNKKIIILVKQIRHGKILQEQIPHSKYIHTTEQRRTEYMSMFKENKINILIMTISIGAEGLDIPNLDIIINASSNKGDIKSIQILGRVLRVFKDKKECYYFDFLDKSKITLKHSKARIKILKKQGYEVKTCR